MTTDAPTTFVLTAAELPWDFETGVGFFIPSHRSSYAALARSWEAADALADFLVVEDHILSFDEDDPSPQFECWSLLAGMAERTERIKFAPLVSPVAFRHPAVLAKAAVTIDHMSEGRFMLGIGGGWFEAEFARFGLPFPPFAVRLAAVTDAVATCRAIWSDPLLPPPPVRGSIPVMIGGDGMRRTIPTAARIAEVWNGFGPFDHWSQRNSAMTAACLDVGRDPASILRTAAIHIDEVDVAPAYREAGAELILVMVTHETPTSDLEGYVKRAGRDR